MTDALQALHPARLHHARVSSLWLNPAQKAARLGILLPQEEQQTEALDTSRDKEAAQATAARYNITCESPQRRFSP